MSKKVIFILIILNIFLLVFSIENQKIDIDGTSDKTFKELFTLHMGIMKLKKTGSTQLINPLDAENVENTIKNELDKIKLIKLNKKDSVIKSIDYYNIISEKKSSVVKDRVLFLRNKLFYNDKYDENLVYELFLEFRKNEILNPIAKKWFESLNNPFYELNINGPFDRKLFSYEEICNSIKTDNKFTLDILVSGEIEKVDKLYFITLYFYSNISKSIITEITYVSDSENINLRTIKELKAVLPKVFLINFASLTVNTNDEDVRIYLDSNYIGRNNVLQDYIIPGNYVITLKKENFENKIENIKLNDFENKEIKLNMDKMIELQIINFYIEPLGTKIFINSIYQGKTPFKKALPIGNYVISCQSELYESYRYILNINNVEPDEKMIVFHLKSKDIKNLFKVKKALYYAAFWNFTFGLSATVPLTVLSYYQFYRTGQIYKNDPYYSKMETAGTILYCLLGISAGYTVLSLVWLFYALADYLKILEKKDFIPIIDFYRNNDNENGVIIGANIKVKL